MHYKKIGVALLLLIICIAGGIVLFGCFFPISRASFNKTAEYILRRKTALDSCSTTKVAITLFRGITITGVQCSKRLDANTHIRIGIPTVRIKYRLLKILPLWKALRGALVPAQKGIGIKKIVWDTRTLFSTLYGSVISQDTLLLSCMKSIAIEQAQVSLDSTGITLSHTDGINGTLRIHKSNPTYVRINVSAEKIRRRGNNIEDPRMAVHFDGPHCVVTRMEGGVYGGKCTGEFDIDCMHDRIDSGCIAISNAALTRWYATMHDTLGSLSGKGTGMFIIDSGGTALGEWSGRGTIKLTEVVTDEIPLIKTIALLTELPTLSHVSFKEISGKFIIQKGKILCDTIRGLGGPLSITIAGWIQPGDVSFDFDMQGIFEASYKDSVSAVIWNAMIPDEDGRRLIKCRIFGTPDLPSVSLDKAIAKRAVRSVFKSFGQGIKGMFKKKKKKNEVVE